MLREIINIRQRKGEPHKRWFNDSYFDFILWFENESELCGFKLCYAKSEDEHVLLWTASRGFAHQRVDDGEEVVMRHKKTPIYVPDGIFHGDAILHKFEKASESIDTELREFIIDKLKEYIATSITRESNA